MFNLSGQIGVVVIGRNEGARLKRCIESLLEQKVEVIIYVDSGSTDDSLDYALAKGVSVVELDTSQPFTMARGRNTGLEMLTKLHPTIPFVQFVDGDCEVHPQWMEAGLSFIASHPDIMCICGFRRERNPTHSIYNRLIDLEWQGMSGKIKACGGDAIYRVTNICALGGFNPGMIAGEEPELCVRLRKQGGLVWRLAQDMTIHDADMHHFAQWWKRAVRCGHAYAEGFAMHGTSPEFHNRKHVISSLFYGLFLPLVMVFLLILTLAFDSQFTRILALLWGGLLAVAWLKVCFSSYRFRRKLGNDFRDSFLYAGFVLLAKLPEAQGILVYISNRLFGRASTLIEYRQDESS